MKKDSPDEKGAEIESEVKVDSPDKKGAEIDNKVKEDSPDKKRALQIDEEMEDLKQYLDVLPATHKMGAESLLRYKFKQNYLLQEKMKEEMKVLQEKMKEEMKVLQEKMKEEMKVLQEKMKEEMKEEIAALQDKLAALQDKLYEEKLLKCTAEKDKAFYSKCLDNIDAILEFQELIESYELQCTLLVPEDLKPTKTNTNPAKMFQTRFERWKWILTNCTDKRFKVIAISLKERKVEDQFCNMVSSVYALVSKRIHFPEARNHTNKEIVAALEAYGMLADKTLIPVVEMFTSVLPFAQTDVASALEVAAANLGIKRQNLDSDCGGSALVQKKAK